MKVKLIIIAALLACTPLAHGDWELCNTTTDGVDTFTSCRTEKNGVVTETSSHNGVVTETASQPTQPTQPTQPILGTPGSAVIYAREHGPEIPAGWQLVAVLPIMENGLSTNYVQFFLKNEKNGRTQVWIVAL